jgi:glucose-6-phosphate isomerase
MHELEYHNLDTAKAFRALMTQPKPYLPRTLDASRIGSCNIKLTDDLTYNYAAKWVDDTILQHLSDLAREQQLIEKYRALANGEIMNTGESRKVLHHLLRGKIDILCADEDREREKFYAKQRERFCEFAKNVRKGDVRGSTGKPFREIVQIGIGGSDLGPRALYLALKNTVPAKDLRHARFISNVDPDDLVEILGEIDFESTLFVLVSKSGNTPETLTNYRFIVETLHSADICCFDPSRHMVAVTSETSDLANSKDFLETFYIDNFIGGRYSSTSAAGGVVLSCALGPEVFDGLLAGAHEADLTALNEDIETNPSLLDALIGVYERSVLNLPTTAILPYSQALSRFPAHLQQLDMESNGKRVNRHGDVVDYPTGPIVFGEPGTNGQHSFYQLLHQGTDIVPLQFIGFGQSQFAQDLEIKGQTSQQKLNANLAAQIVAFALGQNSSISNEQFPGNRPSSLLYGKRLTPRTAGALLAHYENKVMFQGFAWNLNSFDQEGVQLGKDLAKAVLAGSAGVSSSTPVTGLNISRKDEALSEYAKILGIHL